MAQDTLHRRKSAAEQTVRKTEKDISASAETVRELSATLIEMAHANIESAFEFAREAATVRTPSDLANLWAKHTRKQLELLSGQTKELTELGQKFAVRSAPSITPED